MGESFIRLKEKVSLLSLCSEKGENFMELKNIFKMEMYKNLRDKPYIIMILVLTGLGAVLSIMGAFLARGHFEHMLRWYGFSAIFMTLYILGVIFTLFGGGILALLYPFHLLNVDYRNKVMSLMVASGVPRVNYYFVKIGATMLTCFIATAVVTFIPIVTLFVVQEEFVMFIVRNIHEAFTAGNIFQLLLSGVINMVQFVTVMMAAVIISKGKFVGIFLFIGFNFAISIVHGVTRVFVMIVMAEVMDVTFFFFEGMGMILSVLTIGVFGLIGVCTIRKQDL